MDIKEPVGRRSFLKFLGFGGASVGLAITGNPSVAKAVEKTFTPSAPNTPYNPVSIPATVGTTNEAVQVSWPESPTVVTETVLLDKNHFKTWVDDMVELFTVGQCRSYVFTAYSDYIIVKGHINGGLHRFRLDMDDAPDWFKPALTEMIQEGMPGNTSNGPNNFYRGRGNKPIDERTYIRLFNACLNNRVCDIPSLKEFVTNEAKRKEEMAAAETKRIEDAKKTFTNIPGYGPVKLHVA